MARQRQSPHEALLRGFFREVVCCLGRVSARHNLPEDAVWELVKGLDVLYVRARGRSRGRGRGNRPPPLAGSHRLRPHPGIVYLLQKLDWEESAGALHG